MLKIVEEKYEENVYLLQTEEYPDGKLKSVQHFRNGLRHGLTKTYYPSGNIESKNDFLDDKLEGRCINYYDMPGKLIKEVLNFKNGKPHGKQSSYSTSRKLLFRDFYKNGKK